MQQVRSSADLGEELDNLYPSGSPDSVPRTIYQLADVMGIPDYMAQSAALWLVAQKRWEKTLRAGDGQPLYKAVEKEWLASETCAVTDYDRSWQLAQKAVATYQTRNHATGPAWDEWDGRQRAYEVAFMDTIRKPIDICIRNIKRRMTVMQPNAERDYFYNGYQWACAEALKILEAK